MMHTGRRVRLFSNGRNEALRTPREFELPGTDAIIRKEGDRLIVEAAAQVLSPTMFRHEFLALTHLATGYLHNIAAPCETVREGP